MSIHRVYSRTTRSFSLPANMFKSLQVVFIFEPRSDTTLHASTWLPANVGSFDVFSTHLPSSEALCLFLVLRLELLAKCTTLNLKTFTPKRVSRIRPRIHEVLKTLRVQLSHLMRLSRHMQTAKCTELKFSLIYLFFDMKIVWISSVMIYCNVFSKVMIQLQLSFIGSNIAWYNGRLKTKRRKEDTNYLISKMYLELCKRSSVELSLQVQWCNCSSYYG